jgi:hypothetical protein
MAHPFVATMIGEGVEGSGFGVWSSGFGV